MIDANDFYNDYNLPTPEELDKEIDKVFEEEEEKEVKRSKFCQAYLKGNIPHIPFRPLLPNKKYRIYSFSLRRTSKDQPILFRTVAETSDIAIKTIEVVFNKEVTDLFYLAPVGVSEPNYPNILLTDGGNND